MRFARVTYAVIAAGAALWCFMLILPSVLAAMGGASPPVSQAVYSFFRPLCHQLDSRSLHLFGVPLAVCSRCSSIYFGFLVGTLALPFVIDLRRPRMQGKLFFFIALAPMVFDVAAEMTGLYDGATLSRVITGGWFGLLLPFLIIPGSIEGIDQFFTHPSPSPPLHHKKGFTHA